MKWIFIFFEQSNFMERLLLQRERELLETSFYRDPNRALSEILKIEMKRKALKAFGRYLLHGDNESLTDAIFYFT